MEKNNIQINVEYLIDTMEKINKDEDFPPDLRMAALGAEVALRKFNVELYKLGM